MDNLSIDVLSFPLFILPFFFLIYSLLSLACFGSDYQTTDVLPQDNGEQQRRGSKLMNMTKK